MLENNYEEKFDKGTTVFCIDESTYKQHLTKRKEYQILEIGTGNKSGKIRIRGDLNRLVWISDLFFSNFNQAKIKSIKIDDEVYDSKVDCVELTVTFENGKRAWCRAITLDYLANRISAINSFYIDKNAMFVNEISQEIIVKIIEELDKSNQLLDLLISYKEE